MTCVCGALKTYKAPPKSTLHSDWCNDSPRFKPKEVTFEFDIVRGSTKFSGPTPPRPPRIILAGGPKPKCHGCSNNGYSMVIFDAEYEVSYPTNFASGWVGINPWAGKTINWCSGCCRPQDHHQLTTQGCTIVKL